MSTQQILDKMDIINVRVNKTSGRRKLRLTDLNLAEGTKLPPEELASLGSKKVLSPELTKAPEKFYKRLQRAVSSVGITLLSGYAVAKTETKGLVAELERIVAEAERWRDMTLPTIFHEEQEKWFSKDPVWGAILRAEAPTLKAVQSSLQFRFALYSVVGNPDAPGNLADEVNDLGTTLLESVAQEADEYYERNIEEKPVKTLGRRGVISVLTRVRKKLNSLAFLDGAAAPMVKALDELLKAIPAEGEIGGELYWQTVAMIAVLSDPDKVRKHAAGKVSIVDDAKSRAHGALGTAGSGLFDVAHITHPDELAEEADLDEEEGPGEPAPFPNHEEPEAELPAPLPQADGEVKRKPAFVMF
jgi:hypothetical protein